MHNPRQDAEPMVGVRGRKRRRLFFLKGKEKKILYGGNGLSGG